mmetsp:Transcript_23036/g.65405  ORF Transcript_23036/g.65405 Transcript_23036/m.65405 type:complete len:230 (-) Transcript_23036:1310-1999(-)
MIAGGSAPLVAWLARFAGAIVFTIAVVVACPTRVIIGSAVAVVSLVVRSPTKGVLHLLRGVAVLGVRSTKLEALFLVLGFDALALALSVLSVLLGQTLLELLQILCTLALADLDLDVAVLGLGLVARVAKVASNLGKARDHVAFLIKLRWDGLDTTADCAFLGEAKLAQLLLGRLLGQVHELAIARRSGVLGNIVARDGSALHEELVPVAVLVTLARLVVRVVALPSLA